MSKTIMDIWMIGLWTNYYYRKVWLLNRCVIEGYIPDVKEDGRKKKVSWHTLRGKRGLFKNKVMFEKFTPKVIHSLIKSLSNL